MKRAIMSSPYTIEALAKSAARTIHSARSAIRHARAGYPTIARHCIRDAARHNQATQERDGTAGRYAIRANAAYTAAIAQLAPNVAAYAIDPNEARRRFNAWPILRD